MPKLDDQTQSIPPLPELNNPLLRETLLRIIDFGRLPSNWDSYGARKIEPQSVAAAIKFLIHETPGSLPLPSVVPTTAGGVQLEWHCNGVDLEVAFCSPSLIEVWFEDLENGCQSEFSISDDFQPLAPLFDRLSRKQ